LKEIKEINLKIIIKIQKNQKKINQKKKIRIRKKKMITKKKRNLRIKNQTIKRTMKKKEEDYQSNKWKTY